MQQIFSSTTKLMMDAKSGSNMIYLPLDKLMSGTDNQQNTKQTQNLSQSNPATNTNDAISTVEVRGNKDSRARDSRDRESR
jgi:membrane protease subunit HflK